MSIYSLNLAKTARWSTAHSCKLYHSMTSKRHDSVLILHRTDHIYQKAIPKKIGEEMIKAYIVLGHSHCFYNRTLLRNTKYIKNISPLPLFYLLQEHLLYGTHFAIR